MPLTELQRAEFIIQQARQEGRQRVVTCATLTGVVLVDVGAYPASTLDRALPIRRRSALSR